MYQLDNRELAAAVGGAVLASSLAKAGDKSATVVCELYLPAATGRPRVGDVSAALADESLVGKLRLAPFDIVDIDGGQFMAANYGEVHARLSGLFTDEAVRPVEMRDIRVSSSKDQLLSLMEADIAENVKKGWVEA